MFLLVGQMVKCKFVSLFFSQHTLNRLVSFTVELLDHWRGYLDLLKGQIGGEKEKKKTTIWQIF